MIYQKILLTLTTGYTNLFRKQSWWFS
jgi:hypothetical protein